MLFREWKKDKMEAKVSACAPLEAMQGDRYYDFCGRVAEIGPEMDDYEVIDPTFVKSKQTWIIDLVK